jgi:hypothetical protein
MTDARTLLSSLVGRPLETITGRPNRILDVGGDQLIVWTTRSPGGNTLPIDWGQSALGASVCWVWPGTGRLGYRARDESTC